MDQTETTAASATPPTTPVPSVGRIVHVFVENESTPDPRLVEPHPAIVTRVWSASCVDLCVFHPDGGTYRMTSVPLGTSPGQWTWPPRS